MAYDHTRYPNTEKHPRDWRTMTEQEFVELLRRYRANETSDEEKIALFQHVLDGANLGFWNEARSLTDAEREEWHDLQRDEQLDQDVFRLQAG